MRNWNTTSVAPFLKIRLGPRSVEPVAWVSSSLSKLGGDGLVILASSLEERVSVAWLWCWDAVLVEEALELRVGPAVAMLVVFKRNDLRIFKACKHWSGM